MVTKNISRSVMEQGYRMDYLSTGSHQIALTNAEATRFVLSANGSDTPNWRAILKAGGRLPINNYGLEKETVQFPRGSPWRRLTYIPNGDRSEYYGVDDLGFSNVSYLEPASWQRANATNKLHNNVLDKIQSETVNLGNFVGERNQFFKMCGDTFSKIANAGLAVKRRDLTTAVRHLTGHTARVPKLKATLAQNWLELQYGWLPLLSDVHGAAEALEKWPQRHDTPMTKVEAAVKLKDEGEPLFRQHSYFEQSYGWRKKMALRYTVDQDELRFAATIGLTNPLSIAWELTPFSFVVDWALPIGKSLNNLDATLGCRFVDGYENEKLVSQIKTRCETSVYTAFPFTDQYMASPGLATLTRFARAPISDFPDVKLPTLKDPTSVKHCANSLALLVQVFKPK